MVFWAGVSVAALCLGELAYVAWLQWRVFHDKEK